MDFTKFGVCIDIVEICFGIANGKILSAHNTSIFFIWDDNFSKSHQIFTKRALILWRSGLGLLLGTFRHFLTELSPHDMIIVGYYRFKFLLLIIF